LIRPAVAKRGGAACTGEPSGEGEVKTKREGGAVEDPCRVLRYHLAVGSQQTENHWPLCP